MTLEMNEAINEAINAAWEKHAQHFKYWFPGGCGGHIPMIIPIPVMAELGFKEAIREILDKAANVEVRGSRSAKRGGNPNAQHLGCPARPPCWAL